MGLLLHAYLTPKCDKLKFVGCKEKKEKLLSGIYFGIVAVYAVIGLMVFWCACCLLMFLHYRCWRSTCSGMKNGGMPKRVELHKCTVFEGLIFTN